MAVTKTTPNESWLTRGTNSIASGIGTLVAGAAHPAAYVLIGFASKIEQRIPSIKLNSFSIDWQRIGNMKLNQLGNSTSRVTKSFWRAGRAVVKLDIFAAMTSVRTAFWNHSFEIGVAASWGLSSTLFNMILKKTPFTHNRSILRGIAAISLGAAATWAAYYYGAEMVLDQNDFGNIALKVALIGGICKVANVSSQHLLRAIQRSSETIGNAVSSTCKVGQLILRGLDWNILPAHEVPKKGRSTSSAAAVAADPLAGVPVLAAGLLAVAAAPKPPAGSSASAVTTSPKTAEEEDPSEPSTLTAKSKKQPAAAAAKLPAASSASASTTPEEEEEDDDDDTAV